MEGILKHERFYIMHIFLDTADSQIIKKLSTTGLIDGVTTNPSLLSKQNGNLEKNILEISALVTGPVSVEVTEKEPRKVYDQAERIAKSASNIVVKIPCHQDYFSIIQALEKEGIKVNVTLVFSPLQALMVAKLGATYISPFIGRLDDSGVDGIEVLANIVTIKKMYGFQSHVLAASIRSIEHWEKAALVGADAVTIPPAIFQQASSHPLTDRGIEQFDQDWKKTGLIDFF